MIGVTVKSMCWWMCGTVDIQATAGARRDRL